MNESNNPYYIRARGCYRGCVGPGDVYGKAVSNGPAGAGVFRVVPGQCDQSPILPHRTKLRNILDGSSNTILYAEALIPSMDNWTTIGDLTLANMGGSLFSTFLTPNSTSADKVWGPCPGPQGDTDYKAPCVSLGGPNRPPGSSTNNQAGAMPLRAAGTWAASTSPWPTDPSASSPTASPKGRGGPRFGIGRRSLPGNW